MPATPYLLRLNARLTSGLAIMGPSRRERHRDFVLSQQEADGGFSGREGDSDIYYTSFAIRSLAILGELSAENCRTIAAFLAGHDSRRLGVVDLISWLSSVVLVEAVAGVSVLEEDLSRWADEIAARLESVRTADGGYAKSPEGTSGSMYQSFLVALTYELIGRELPHPNALIQFIYDRQLDDGGFVEIKQAKRSGTNPTAAAAALLTMFEAADEEIREDVREFLKSVRAEGGFQANSRIPFPDGLSTFTGYLTLQDLGIHDVLRPEQVELFVTDPEHGLELPTGGFRGAAWDDQADVEYTFYGLGNLALAWSADD
jgi:geranylgeranyl transferase type-2 subunit beta